MLPLSQVIPTHGPLRTTDEIGVEESRGAARHAPARGKSVTILHNAASGTGGRADVATAISDALTQAGHTPRVLSLRGHVDQGPIDLHAVVRTSDLLVIAGGDGTVHHTLGALMSGPSPVYHFPLGTENLFSRQFGTNRRPATLVDAMERWTVRKCDVGECNGRPFAIMMSVGFDACVVERVAAERRGGITKIAYVRAAMKELLRPRTPTLTVDIDGRRVIDGRSGLLVVANSRQYAARLDPARNADMQDGLLDVVFYPHRSRLGLVRWLMATAAGLHTAMPGLVKARGKAIAIRATESFPCQMDGEAVGSCDAFDIRTRPEAIRVLDARVSGV